MDRFTALQVFRQVAELKSFAEAGRRLNLSAAAISKNIAELEVHLGSHGSLHESIMRSRGRAAVDC